MDIVWEIVCGTGHRTLSEHADESWAREKLFRCAEWLRDKRGTRAVLSGMARGFDLWWADAITQTAGLELWACVPFKGQTNPWSAAERREWERLMALAHLEPFPVDDLPAGLSAKQRSGVVNQRLHQRNINMLDIADAVAALWEPGRLDGGTAAALRVAARRGMPGVHIDPASRRVREGLPDLDQLTKMTLYHGQCRHVAEVGAAADIRARHASLNVAGEQVWRMRAGRPRETRDQGCDTCRIPQPERAALAAPA